MNALEQFILLPLQQVILIGFAVAGIYWLILYDNGDSLVSQTGSLRSQITQAQAELARKTTSLNRSKQFKETLRIKDEQFQAFSSFIPEDLKVSDMMRVMSNEAKAAGVNIVGVNGQSSALASPNNLTEPVGVSVKLQGSFPEHLLFLSFLSRLDAIYTVDDMKFFTSGERADKTAIVDFSATIVGYRYLGDSNAASVSQRGKRR